MATIKSYTDLSQSKTLSKILPLESADMHYFLEPTPVGNIYIPSLVFIEKHLKSRMPEYDKGDIPCWSLAALYNILPNTEHISTTLSRGGWIIEQPEYVDKWWCEYEDENDHTRDITVTADNPVDACVAMILKLNELKML